MESLHQDVDKHALRRFLRHQRRALSQHEQRLAAQRLSKQLKALPEVRRARRISLYLPVNGEIDPTPVSGLKKKYTALSSPSAPVH